MTYSGEGQIRRVDKCVTSSGSVFCPKVVVLEGRLKRRILGSLRIASSAYGQGEKARLCRVQQIDRQRRSLCKVQVH